MIFERVDRGFNKKYISRDDEIELNKQMSKTMSEIRKSLKTGKCFYCGKTISSCCNSHNVPRYCLENIAKNGSVLGPNAIYELPKMGMAIGKNSPGINESGTFYLICDECDNTIFKDYENPKNYKEGLIPTQKMLSQIAMKNYLKFIHKRQLEIALWEKAYHDLDNRNDPFSYIGRMECATRLQVSKMDLKEYIKDFERAKLFSGLVKEPGYHLIYYTLLNYVAPIAIQAPIVISIGLDGEIVNDIFSTDPDYKINDLHLCVFPQKETTAVLLFVENGDTHHKQFEKDFEKLDDESKIGIINYFA